MHKPIKAFRKGSPDNLDFLEVMFRTANVDGTSSVMPGVEDIDAIRINEDLIDVDDEDNATPTPSPLPPPRGKRGASLIPCSPTKSKKHNVPKDFARFVDHVISEDRSEQSSNATESSEIEIIMEDVVKCGASEISDEYYMATKLFGKPTNRSFFRAMKTSEGRLMWLKRQYEDYRRKN